MRGADDAARVGERRAGDLVDAELVEQHHRAAYVDQRVDPADLVEKHGVRRDAVHVALDLGEAAEGVEGPGARSLR